MTTGAAWVISPAVAVALRLPVVFKLPRLMSVVAVATTLPLTVDDPRSSAPPLLATVRLPAPVVVTVPRLKPPEPSVRVISFPIALTKPTKLFPAWVNKISSPAEKLVAPDTSNAPR